MSIFLGVYYLYVVGRWLLTTLFSLRVLYQEHGFSPNLLWGLGPGQDVFPMRFYRRWRRFKQHFAPEDPHRGRTPLPPPRDYEPLRPRVPLQHDYLTVHEEKPPLPSRNMYPPLPSSDRSTASSAEKSKDRQAQVYQSAAHAASYAVGKRLSAGPTSRTAPPAADSRTVATTSGSAIPLATIRAPEADRSRSRGTPDVLLPTGVIGETIKHRL